MTNLTDAQLTALAIEHYPNPDDPDGCWSCCEAWVCPTALALAELRQMRGERKNFDSALEEQMRRGDEYWVENVQLRTALDEIRRTTYRTGDTPFLTEQRFHALAHAALASVKGGDA